MVLLALLLLACAPHQGAGEAWLLLIIPRAGGSASGGQGQPSWHLETMEGRGEDWQKRV